MGELLQNIFYLREYVYNLREISDKKVYRCCELAIKIADNEEEIEKMKVTKENLEENIMNFKLKKGILFTWPIGTLISIIFFTYLIFICLDKLTLGAILFTIIGAPVTSISLSFAFSAFLMHSKIFTNYLIKKYSVLKEMINKLNNLIDRSRIMENNLKGLKEQKEVETIIITNYEEIIESKNEELHKLEQEYFNNIKNKPITKGTTYNVSTTGKKRTRTIGEPINKCESR